METGEKVTLSREGFKDLIVRKDEDGYSILEYVDHYGGERWGKVPFSDEQVQSQIGKYHVN